MWYFLVNLIDVISKDGDGVVGWREKGGSGLVGAVGDGHCGGRRESLESGWTVSMADEELP